MGFIFSGWGKTSLSFQRIEKEKALVGHNEGR